MLKIGCSTVIGAVLAVLSHGALAKDQAASPLSFMVEAQSLPTALNEWAQQAGLQVIWQPDAGARQFVSSRVAGTLDAESALKLLLQGSGFTYSFIDSRTVAIRPEVATVAKRITWATGDHQGASERHSILQAVESEPPASNAVPVSASPANPEASAELPNSGPEEIVVTGSHIRGSQAAGSKVIVIDRQEIERSGYGRVQDVLATLTQNFNSVNEVYSKGTTSNDSRGTEVQLRGLGPGTTLTLVNGQRQAAGGTLGLFVDISSIPTAAIERIEVLPEGSSALYGSDAIGGVVNIITRKDFVGAEASLRGSTAEGEANEIQFSHLFGTAWERGRAMIGYQYYERDRLPAGAREYSATSDDLRAFGGSDFRRFFSNPGTILSSATRQPIAAIPAGQNGTNVTAANIIPGAINYSDDVTYNSINPRSEVQSVFLNAGYDITDTWELFVDGRYATRDMKRVTGSAKLNLTVPTTNAFNRFGAPVIVAYDFTDDLGPLTLTSSTETYTASVGAAGALVGAWQLNVSGAYAEETNRFRTLNSPVFSLTPYLSNSNPATALNVFGDGSNTSAATLAAIRGGTQSRGASTTSAFSVIADGPLVNLPAGAIRLALGGDYRQERLTTGTSSPISSKRDISALFGELAVPLLGADAAGGQRLALSLAGRYEDYGDFGTTFNPKAGLSWRAHDSLLVRGTVGTSFRAPPFFYSRPDYNPAISFDGLAIDPATGGLVQVLLLNGNNPDLQEETAVVWTAGIDFTPPQLEGLSVSLTYFNIDYSDKIVYPGPAFSMLVEGARWAEVITFNPTQAQVDAVCNDPNFFGICSGSFAAIIDQRGTNLSSVQVRGLDAEVRYSMSTKTGDWGVGLRGTYTFDYKTRATDASPAFETVDTFQNPLALAFAVNLSWSLRNWSAHATVNHDGSYTNPGTLPASKIDSWTTVDFGLGYRLESGHGWLDNTRFSLNANNVFGEEPPFVNVAGVFAHDGANANLMGRQISGQFVKAW